MALAGSWGIFATTAACPCGKRPQLGQTVGVRTTTVARLTTHIFLVLKIEMQAMTMATGIRTSKTPAYL